MNSIGVLAGLVTFLGVWFGHVAVRKLEFVSPTIWLPASLFALAGLACEVLALASRDPRPAAVFGILGMTLLWDALEFTRQQRRIQKGHAPANPGNPRHARLLAEYAAATTIDLLKRNPVGRLVSADEAVQLLNH